MAAGSSVFVNVCEKNTCRLWLHPCFGTRTIRRGASFDRISRLEEQFQLLIDNNYAKVLHPRRLKAPKGTEVYGPTRTEEVMQERGKLT